MPGSLALGGRRTDCDPHTLAGSSEDSTQNKVKQKNNVTFVPLKHTDSVASSLQRFLGAWACKDCQQQRRTQQQTPKSKAAQVAGLEMVPEESSE